MILLVMAYFLILAYPLAFRIYQRVIQGTLSLPPTLVTMSIIAHDRTMHDTHNTHNTRQMTSSTLSMSR